nr:LacI family transcriptional regulator [Streptomyces sp. NBC_00886]
MAREAGVSTATVTRTLQNPDVVKPATRERVMEAVRQLGYSPNPMARNLRHRSPSGVIGLVTAGFTNIFQAWVAAGAEAELRRAGLQLLIGSTDDDPAREPELAKIMIDRRVSALLMMPDGDDRDFLRPAYTYGTPVVLVGRPANGLDVDVVMTRDDRAVDEATDQFLNLGHRRIAALAGRADSFRAAQRLAGYRAAIARHGMPEQPELIVTDLTSPQEVSAAITRMMEMPEPPTAVLALNLGISSGVLLDRIVNHRNNIAFVALDENDLSAGLGISAITRDPVELGRQAALLAIERIANPTARPRTVTLPSLLVQRGSGELPPAPADAGALAQAGVTPDQAVSADVITS